MDHINKPVCARGRTHRKMESNALFIRVFVISTLYAFMRMGFAPAIAASAASSITASSAAFPMMDASASVALTGVGATAPSTILAALQTPSCMAITEATLAMAKSTGFHNVNLRNMCRVPAASLGI